MVKRFLDDIVDIHNHLLPGVDDGAQSFDESLRHLRAMRNDGVTRLAVSPHLFGWLTEEPNGLTARLDRLEEVFAQVEAEFAGHPDIPKLYFNQEILCQTPAMARALFLEPRAGLRGTRYALVEFGFDLKIDCTEIVRAVMESGRRMIISHPERFRRDGHPVDVPEILSWKTAGALLQVNGGSLLGDYGRNVSRTAWALLHGGHADLIATDHHADQREVSPAAVAAAIVEYIDVEQARRLMCENPGRILEDLDTLAT
jgi:protein-tyrosine phosphatase